MADAIGLGPIDRKVMRVQVPLPALMISALQKQPNGTIQITVTIPLSVVKKTWDEVIESAVKNAEVAGFRKGMAPRHLVEEKLDKTKIQEGVLKKLLPQYYIEAIKEHNINPIMSPKIHVEKLEDPQSLGESKGWQFTALTCEAPNVDLNGYKDKIKSITIKSKIVIPGKENQAPKFEDIVKALTDSVKVDVPGILLTSEADRLLAQTLDEIKKLGLTLDQYLQSTGKTPEGLREEYVKKAKNDITLEFALQKIAQDEHITVEEKEIEEAIQKAKDSERKNLENNRYLLANILRQQKTLDFLKNL